MNWAAIASLFVGVVITIVGFVLGWYVFPGIVEDEIAENVELNNGTDQFKRFEVLPIPLDFKVYLFHVVNPDDVNAGAKPTVEEKGPYIYKQSRKKTDIQWSSNKRISYYEYQYFDYDQDASGDLKETDYVTVLNPALNGAIQIIEMTKLPYILKMLNRTVQEVFEVDNIFLNIRVGDFLFDGYDICDFEKIKKISDKVVKAEAQLVCLGLLVMPTKNIASKMNVTDDSDPGKLVFTFLGHKKDKHDGKYTVNAGLTHVDKTGWIEKWEDQEYLSNWLGNDSHCNKVRGRDAVIYEPSLTEKSTVTVFNTDICRTVDLRYSNDVEFRDVTALEYRLGEDVFQAPKEDNDMCYCLNVTKGAVEDTGCVKNGMVELFTCYNAPILLSYPHFMWADKEYKESVDGLKVDISKHKTYAVVEPNTGTPLQGSKRVQFNMYVNSQDGIKFLEFYENASRLIPIVWLDEGFTINDELYQDLYDLYISKTYLITGVTWGIIGVGLAVIVITPIVVLVLNKRRAKQTV